MQCDVCQSLSWISCNVFHIKNVVVVVTAAATGGCNRNGMQLYGVQLDNTFTQVHLMGHSLVLQGNSGGEVPSYLYWLHRELKSLNESRYLTLGDSGWSSYYPKCPVWGGSYQQSQKTEDTLNVCACSKHFSAKRSGMGEALGESSEENLSLYTCFTCFISWSKLLILTAIFSKEMFLDA